MIPGCNLQEHTNPRNFEKEVENEFKPLVSFFEKELQKMRTNRAHPSLVEDIKILAYGNLSPLKHLALISCQDSQTISIHPFDRVIIAEIEKALSQSEIGLNPKNDGGVLKISLPVMSKERRAELVKQIGKKKEEILIQTRIVRQNILSEIKKTEKEKRISEDLSQKLQKSLQIVFDKISLEFQDLVKKKEIQINE